MNTCSIFDERRPYGEARGVRCTTREKKGRRDTSATSSFELLECALLLFVGRSIFSRWSLVVGSRLCSMRYALRGFWLWLCPATCVASMCGCIQNKKIPAFRGGHARATARKKETQAGTSDLNWGLGLGLGGALGCKSRVHKCRNKCKCKCKCKCKGAPRPKLPRQKKPRYRRRFPCCALCPEISRGHIRMRRITRPLQWRPHHLPHLRPRIAYISVTTVPGGDISP
jgi:hypothetical protein